MPYNSTTWCSDYFAVMLIRGSSLHALEPTKLATELPTARCNKFRKEETSSAKPAKYLACY
jgi:hypothetical protein